MAASSPQPGVQLVGRDRELAELARAIDRGGPVTLVGVPGVGKTALAACFPRADVVTAVEPRRLAGESLVRVGPLGAPSIGATSAEILAAPAVVLFLEHAARIGRPVRSPANVAGDLAAIAVACSGLPRGLVAAAELLALHPIAHIARVLAQPESVVRASADGTGTLAASFAPLWASLSGAARALLVELAPHRCGAVVPAHRAHTSAPLRELVEHEVLGSRARPPDELVLTVPLLVARSFLAQLDAETRRETRRAHAMEIAARVETAVEHALRSGSPKARATLDELGADVEDALVWAAPDGDVITGETLVRAALGLADATGGIGPSTLPPIEAIVARGHASDGGRARLAIARASVAEREGRTDAALSALTEAASWAAPFPVVRAEAALALGTHHMQVRRDAARARTFFSEAAASPDPVTAARARISLGGTYLESERFGDAIRELELTRDALSRLDAPRLQAMATTNRILARVGHWPSPRSAPPRVLDVEDGLAAVTTFEGIGDARGAAIARLDTGLVLTTLLRFEEAAALLEHAVPTFEALGHPGLVFAASDLGCVALALGDDERARRELARARTFADRNGSELLGGVARAELADVAWETGDLRTAREALGHARRLLGACGDSARFALVGAEERALDPDATAPPARPDWLDPAHSYAHAIGVYAALHARRCGAPCDEEEATVLPWLENVVALMEAPPATRGSDGQGIPWAVWLAVRRFLREVGPAVRRPLLERAHGVGRRSALLLDCDARSVRTVAGSWIDLSRREKLFATLEALAGAPWEHVRPVRTVGELAARVWPGERILPDAAAGRVYVALASLRKLAGMRDVIVREGDGYRLAPGIEVHVFRAAYTRS